LQSLKKTSQARFTMWEGAISSYDFHLGETAKVDLVQTMYYIANERCKEAFCQFSGNSQRALNQRME
jgi:hypothetical protein